MEYNTFNLNQLKRFAQRDDRLASVRNTPPTNGTFAFDLFDRFRYPFVSLERYCSLLLQDLCPQSLADDTFLSDADWSKYCDRDYLSNFLLKQQLITTILLQSTPNHKLRLSWAWKAEDENPVIIGSTGDGSGRVSVEGTISELLRTLWARFLGSLRRLEDLVLNGYDASMRAVSQWTKKMITDTGGRGKLEGSFADKIDRKAFSKFLSRESESAEQSLRSIISYDGTAGLRRSSRDWRRERQRLLSSDMSYKVPLTGGFTASDSEHLLVWCLRQYCFNVAIKDSFVSRRMFSDHVCCLGRQLFPDVRFLKILADQGLSFDITSSDVAQSIFFSLRGWLVDEDDRVLADVDSFVTKVRRALLLSARELREQSPATDPCVLSSQLLQFFKRSNDEAGGSVSTAIKGVAGVTSSRVYFAFS